MYPADAPLAHAEETLELGLRDTAFVLIDVYGRGYDEGEGPGDQPDWRQREHERHRAIITGHIVPAKRAARSLDLPVVYVKNFLSPALTERTEWRNLSMRGRGADVLQAWREPNDVLTYSKIIAPEPGEFEIKKQLFSGFFETQLDSLLRSLGSRNLVIVGWDARVCLGTTAVDAMYRNYRVIVLRDCTSTYEFPETAEGQWANFMAIRQIETMAGYTATSQQWIAACARVGRPR